MTVVGPIEPRSVELSERSVVPPYMPWTGFRSLIRTRLPETGLPQVFDRSFFGSISGSLIAQQRGALRFFDLLDDEWRPTDVLDRLIHLDEDAAVEFLRQLALPRYEAQVELGMARGTQGQLIDSFRDMGLSGSTISKAVGFYLGLAEYTDLPTSPFFKRGGPTSGSGVARKTAASRRRKTSSPAVEAAVTVAPSASVSSADGALDAKTSAYVDMLMKLAETASDEAQPALLDRIERALKLSEPGANVGT